VKNNIYTDFDTIFDTRLTTLALLFPEDVDTEIRSGYLFRTSDGFEKIPHIPFKHIYATRNDTVLRLSDATGILDMINRTAFDINIKKLGMGDETDCKIIINIYPYTLCEEELDEIRNTLMTCLFNSSNIIFMRKENIEPKWIDENIEMFVSYSGADWLNENITNGKLLATSIVNTNMVIPNLFTTTAQLNDDDLETFYKLTSPFVKLAIIDTYYFSLKPREKNKRKNTTES